MFMRPGFLLVLLAVILAAGSPGQALAEGRHAPMVTVHVDSVLAADTNEGIDSRLQKRMGRRLQALFSYTTYRLVSHQDGQTECGKMIVFTLPGGRILHVQPRAVDHGMIAMELLLFQGPRPLMSTDLKLKNNGMLIVGGPRYQQGMLIISIAASTAGAPPNQPHAASTSASADVK
jgi:hypothetical protein